MKNAFFWDVSPCGLIEIYVSEERVASIFSNRLTLFLACVISSTLEMEATRSSETSVYSKRTRRHIPGDGILHGFFSSARFEVLRKANMMICFCSVVTPSRLA
jgi:hypothetical protein